MEFRDLDEARRRILGVSREALARLSGLDSKRLAEIEVDGVATLIEWNRLGRILGVDPEDLAESPIVVDDPMVGVLPYLEEFQEVSPTTKARIIGAAAAARDLAHLRELLGEEESTWVRYQRRRALARPTAGMVPWQQGRHYAGKLRGRFALRRHPISSMRDFLATHFPEITVLFADLADDKLAGVSMADEVRGPVMVLNTVGKNANHLVRRFSMAHELCHLLVDRPEGSALAQLSGYKTETQLDTERRANSFATRLLCPEDAVSHIKDSSSDMARVKHLMATFGLHYQTARLHLLHVSGIKLPLQAPAALLGEGGTWREAEASGLDQLPLPEIPPERRTVVARTAAAAYARGLIGRGEFAEMLAVDRTAPLDHVLDLLGLEPPGT